MPLEFQHEPLSEYSSATPGGTQEWAGVGSVLDEIDGNCAQAVRAALPDPLEYPTVYTTEGLYARTYDWSGLPDGQPILGIEVAITRYTSAVTGGSTVVDKIVRLIGVTLGDSEDNKARTAVEWTDEAVTITYGGMRDLWGYEPGSLTTDMLKALVDNEDLGVYLLADLTLESGDDLPFYAYVDRVAMTVYFPGERDDEENEPEAGGGLLGARGANVKCKDTDVLFSAVSTPGTYTSEETIEQGSKLVLGHAISGSPGTGASLTITMAQKASGNFVPHHGDGENIKSGDQTASYSSVYYNCAKRVLYTLVVTDGTHTVWRELH